MSLNNRTFGRQPTPRFSALAANQSPQRACRWSLIVAAYLCISATTCEAQLFGSPRQLGQPLTRRPSPGVAAEVTAQAGQIQGNERFLRGSRRRGDFVGSDRFDQRGFVGSQQGSTTGPFLQSTIGIRPERDRTFQINQPLPRPSANQPYPPRLQVDFTVPDGIGWASQLNQELSNPDFFSSGNRFEVLVEGRTAILRGEVADARERDLAELLVSFEPGISEVQNRLTLANQSSAPTSATRQQPTDDPNPVPPPAPQPSIQR